MQTRLRRLFLAPVAFSFLLEIEFSLISSVEYSCTYPDSPKYILRAPDQRSFEYRESFLSIFSSHFQAAHVTVAISFMGFFHHSLFRECVYITRKDRGKVF
ncbi:hypothetical protein J3R30DRAFT_556422 [Lentinula aciculospora]|uniref:Secreted protein n=1 Tax=Lentinula aciculospora TaxID=153920 RepID=A0A9W9DL22_9AGAR|nr:hypothetical protein J3R30DRAFT_556422 [Lentinula aciculospora]